MRQGIKLLRRNLSRLDLRQRLMALLLFPLLIVTTSSLVIDYQIAKQTATQAFDRALHDIILDLQHHLRDEMGQGRFDLTRALAAAVHSNEPDMLFVSVRDRQGVLKMGEADLNVALIPAQDTPSVSDAIYRQMPVRIAAHRLNLPSFQGYIVVAETTHKREKTRQKILTAMLWPNLLGVMIAFFVVLAGVQLGLQPLINLENEIARRSLQDLSPIELSNCPAEIRPMMERLNQLFDLLHDATTRQQRFISDAAHQMRTPLAALQAQLDVAVSEQIFTAHQERLQQLEASTSRLGRLLGQLLVYARAEKLSQLTHHFELLSLPQLVEKSASMFLDMALARDIDLGFDIQPATVSGLPWMLQELLSNLIDNAIRYTPPGGYITVRCAPGLLEVEDNGPGIAPEHHELIFERFFRVSGVADSGCGLGLPIVRQIAQLHGATVHLSNVLPHGALFQVRFPAA